MHKPSTYVVATYFPIYLTYISDLLFIKWIVTKVKLVDIHPQLSHKGHLVDGVLVGVNSMLSWALKN